jgi:hypothetical protein
MTCELDISVDVLGVTSERPTVLSVVDVVTPDVLVLVGVGVQEKAVGVSICVVCEFLSLGSDVAWKEFRFLFSLVVCC